MIEKSICLLLVVCLNPWPIAGHALPSQNSGSRAQLIQVPESISEAQELANQKSPMYSSSPRTVANKTLPIQQLDAALRTRDFRRIDALLARIKETTTNANAVHLWRGLSFGCQQRYEEAVDHFDHCINFDDAAPSGLYMVGFAYFKVEECSKAIKTLTLAINKFPNRDSYECRANCYMALKSHDQAMRDFLLAAKYSGHFRTSYLSKAANVLRIEKKYPEAIATYNAAIKNSPAQFLPAALLGQSLCYQDVKRWNEAARNCTEAIKTLTAPAYRDEMKMPNLANCYFQRAKCYDNLGKPVLAAADRLAHSKISSSLAGDFLSK